MLPNTVLAFLLGALAANAHALPAAAPVRADLPGYTGFDDCRIAPLEPAPRRELVDWRGPCKDGFATGQGELDWKDDKGTRYRLKATLVRGEVQGEGEMKTEAFTYIGTYRRGVPHGSGFFTYKGGNMYEGDVVEGKREGKGIMLEVDRSKYTGEWKNGRPEGLGEIKYGLGGSYSGEWRAGREHGKGTMVFAGSGRKFEGQFDNGHIAGIAPVKDEETKDSLVRRDGARELNTNLPLDQRWDQLTEGQKNLARAPYALESGDDPPYPLKGRRETMAALVKLNTRAGAAEGRLLIHVLVGANGKAKHVRVFTKPELVGGYDVDKFVEAIGNVLMLDSYKPAMCQGQPCEMAYRLDINFDTALGPDRSARSR